MERALAARLRAAFFLAHKSGHGPRGVSLILRRSIEAIVNESSPSDLKARLFAFCCIGFVAGVGLALFTTWDACCGASNNFGGDTGDYGGGGGITLPPRWVIAHTPFALAFAP